METGRYFLACQRYIELNPVRARIVSDPADYAWSSYRAHALGVSAKMWTPHAMYQELSHRAEDRCRLYRESVSELMDTSLVQDIRLSLNTGLVFGSERFRDEVEQLTGQPQRLGKRGPKPTGQ